MLPNGFAPPRNSAPLNTRPGTWIRLRNLPPPWFIPQPVRTTEKLRAKKKQKGVANNGFGIVASFCDRRRVVNISLLQQRGKEVLRAISLIWTIGKP